MIFASGIFLMGLLGLAAPIAIHLLARQRTRILEWGAMDFLRQSISTASSRRKRLRDLLLLLLRVLAIICVVLAFAQPLISHALLGGRKLETVFIWDVSLSTEALDENGEPFQAAMKTRLLEELDRLPSRSRVKILVAGAELKWLRPEALVLSQTNRNALKRAIEEQSSEAGGSLLANAVLRALEFEEDEIEARRFRDIVVVHDFQRRAWQAEEAAQWSAIHRRLEADANLSLRALGPETGPDPDLSQVAVTRLDTSRDTLAPEVPARLQATIRNFSERLTARGDVVWLVNGREVERTAAVDLAPGGELKLEEVIGFETVGSHQVECEFETGRDALPADNRAVCVVTSREALPILIVDDTERTQRGQILPSEFLVAALGESLAEEKDEEKRANAETETPGAASLFAPQVIRSAEWEDSTLEGQSAVFLVAAKEFPEERIADLRRFAEQGGGLWVILDAQEEALDDGAVSLLTQLGLEPLTDTTQAIATDRDRPYRLKAADPESPFAERMVAQSLDLHRAEVRALRALNRPLVLPEERLLETAEGHPFVLSFPVGTGRLVLQTADLGRRNTNLPILQSFVPFVREVAWETAGASLPQRNLDPGAVIRLASADAAEFLGGPALALPDDTRQEMPLQEGKYQSRDTLQPGLYRIYDRQGGDPATATSFFSVRRPAAESRLDFLTPAELAALLEPLASPETVANEARGKSPVAFWLAILAGLLFLAEALLARSIAGKRAERTSRLDLKPIH